ncbi:MAG: nicotinate-nucleotide--dimethylbenzimidazole phosphoribosyltransferase [Candidatus Binataceae bacterium]
MMLLEQALASIELPDALAAQLASERLDSLTKPPGSLGHLEEIVRNYAAMRRDPEARMGRGAIAVFVGDHGVTEEGVSAYPREVTAEMLRNIARGGAAISVLARRLGYLLRVVDVGVATDTSGEGLAGVVYRRVGAGTRNLLRERAMTLAQAHLAIEIGINVARELVDAGATLIGIGEMGIGNSTCAAALLAAITGIRPEDLVGRGSGLDDAGVRHKIDVVTHALALHQDSRSPAQALLAALGGFEIGAMAGVCISGAALHVPSVVDGFIATAAAALACEFHPSVAKYLFFSHRSAEGGHALALEHLDARPILDLEMRLGEGTGAAIAMSVIESALALYRDMATFAQARVSGKLR